MHRLEEYVSAGGKLLRCGYTTGTCATAAAYAACELLLGGSCPSSVVVSTPAGIDVLVEVEDSARGRGWASAAVMKDAGDDPDVTDGALICARVRRTAGPGVAIDGGEGVGRVTRPGLDRGVGCAAINTAPRTMIAAAVRSVAEAHGYDGGLAVEVSVPGGEELARRTFNPRLGIEGGISILGTSGIVRPMSEEALVSSIKLDLRVLAAAGVRHAVMVPGNYGRDFARGALGIADEAIVSCSNYVGEALDEAARLGFASLLVVGHLGKLVKVAGGIMNTHSRVADCRMEVLAAHAALAGAARADVCAIMGTATTDAALDLLDKRGLLEATMASLTERLQERLAYRAGEGMRCEAVVFSNQRGVLGKTTGADALVAMHAHKGEEA